MPVSAPSLSPQLFNQLVQIVGRKWVLNKPSDLYLYSFDSALDRSMPSAVVFPGTTEQVGAVVRVLAQHKKSFVARGAATSLCGGPVPLQGAVVIALARLNKIGKLDMEKREIFVEPGVVNLKLQQAISGDGLFFAPDPGSQKACTIGGNVATNAGGPHCLKYGVTTNHVSGLEVVFPDGKVAQLRVDDPGYDTLGFFVGSEGTLGVATKIKLKLLKKPAHVRTMLASFPSIEDAIQSVTDIISDGLLPATLEAMDKTTVNAVEAFAHAGYPTDAEAVLLIEVDGDNAPALEEEARRIEAHCKKNNQIEFRFAKDEADRAKLWEGRRGAYPAMARLAPNVLVEDGAVPRTKLPEALKRIKEIAAEANLRVALLFHAGDGNLHPQIVFDERDEAQTKIVKEAGYKMLKACVDLGGTISGEHGIGVDKREAMRWLFTRDTLSLFRRLKNVFDPENLCNPDKLIPLISKSATTVSTDKPVIDTEISPMPAPAAAPDTDDGLIKMVKDFSQHKTRFGITGTRTKSYPKEASLVSTVKLDRILDLDVSNCTLTVQAGALVERVKQEVEQQKRYLWAESSGTIGGMVATRSSVVPPLRDLILGMRVLLPNGEVAVLGAKTMKNVAGYDAAKLLIGSWGTLGVILDVTFRLFSYPAAALQADTNPKAFVFRDLHKKIKRAFDPEGILSPRMISLTEKDLEEKPKEETKAPTPDEQAMKNIADKFWM